MAFVGAGEELAFDWKADFTPWILARGQKYFEEGRVLALLQKGNTITAEVEGSENYTVEMDLPGGLPGYMECSCPYAQNGENCKHMAAALFAIDAGEYAFTDEIPERGIPPVIEHTRMQECWTDAVGSLPETALETKVDDDGELYTLTDNCEAVFTRAFSLGTEQQREQMHSWFWEHRDPAWPKGTEEMDRIFLFLPWRDDLRQLNEERYYLK